MTSGRDLGFVCIGIRSFCIVDKSEVEFFCSEHQVFITRFWSNWNRCFAKKNTCNRPACCTAALNNVNLDLIKQPTIKLSSYFSTFPENTGFDPKTQQEVLNKLGSSKGKYSVKANKNSVIPEALRQKMERFGHLILGEEPKREYFHLCCPKHNQTIETNVDKYRMNLYGMKCCSDENENGATGFPKHIKFRKNV